MDELSISTTVSFREDFQNKWQTMYISSLYGTMFIIYGRILYDETNKKLVSIDLRLINYKGTINLGIVDAKFDEFRKRVKINEKDAPLISKIVRVISINVELKAMHQNKGKLVPINTTFTKCDLNSIYIEVNRKLIPLGGEGEDLVDEVFDSEFYYRDGLRSSLKLNNKYRSGSELNESVNIEGKPVDEFGVMIEEIPEKEKDVSRKGAGAVCPKGYNKIIF